MPSPLQLGVDLRVSARGVVSRRGFLRRAAAGGAALAAGLRWGDCLRSYAGELRRQGRACILLWMAGGPSQFETFDPKPGAETQGPDRGHCHQRAGHPHRRALDADGPGDEGSGPDPLHDQQGGQPRPGHLPAAHQLRPLRRRRPPRLRRGRRQGAGRGGLRAAPLRQHQRGERRPQLPRGPLRPLRGDEPQRAAGQPGPARLGRAAQPPAGTAEGAGGAAGATAGRRTWSGSTGPSTGRRPGWC